MSEEGWEVRWLHLFSIRWSMLLSHKATVTQQPDLKPWYNECLINGMQIFSDISMFSEERHSYKLITRPSGKNTNEAWPAYLRNLTFPDLLLEMLKKGTS